jgi:hypothetical protein
LPARLSEIQQAHPHQRILTVYEDEARFGQHGTLTRVWARKGSRPKALQQVGYENLYLLAAVCPETGADCAMIAPYLDTHVINVFLEQLSASLPADVHAALVWDGAGYHKSGTLQVPQNITLVPLPPYSPQLNPIENLWHYLRSHYWSNRCYADYDALEAAACHAWQQLVAQSGILKTVCAAA